LTAGRIALDSRSSVDAQEEVYAVATEWHLAGEEVAQCNCAWGCPCQFNALPTTGRCEAIIGFEVREGHFGGTSLAGTRFVEIVSWPGAIHEGNGTRVWVVDERAESEQRHALDGLLSGREGGAYFEVFASVCPDARETVFAPIEFEVDRERRLATIRIPGIAETSVEPIRNPISGEEHRALINLPGGFEYQVAEMGNTVRASVTAGDPLAFTLENTYAQLNEFDWSNA
jgi:hypothetical protein